MKNLSLDLNAMLARKEAIDNRNQSANNMETYTRWIVDAVELLLRVELERQKSVG